MNHVIIAGGSGELGTLLTLHLRGAGYRVTIVGRTAVAGKADAAITWNDDLTSAIDGATAVVNMAGANVGEGRWTSRRRHEIRASRLDTTRIIVDALRRCAHPPAFISTSAVGYYGNTTVPVNEGHPAGATFLASVTDAWERAAIEAATITRVAVMRVGVVLHPRFGALGRMLPLFRLGLGGPLGSGRQWFPWVHAHDVVAAYQWAIEGSAHGPYNIVAPEQVTMGDFASALGAVLHRPALLAVPTPALRVMLGSQADIVLHGQRVAPYRLQGDGYRFHYPVLKGALQQLCGKP
jgi:uncharacterized protein (TIGR01777 family)